MLSIVGSRLRMALRGRRFRIRTDRALPPEEGWRMDVCFSAASSINIANPLIGSALTQKYISSALSSELKVRSKVAEMFA